MCAYACVWAAVLMVLLATPATARAHVPVRPRRDVSARQSVSARQAETPKAGKQGEPKPKAGVGKGSAKKGAGGSAKAGGSDAGKGRAGSKAAPHAKTRRHKKVEEPEDDPVEMKRAAVVGRGGVGRGGVGRGAGGRGRKELVRRERLRDEVQPQRAASKTARLVQPRWRVKELPPAPLRQPTHSVQAAVTADASALTPVQEAALEQELREADEPANADEGMNVVAPGGGDHALTATPAPTSVLTAAGAVLGHPTRAELTEEALQPVVLPGLYRNGRLVVPPPMKGTREILVHQNQMADAAGLERIRNDDDLQRLRDEHRLVSFPESASLRVNPELSAARRCARVWTVRFAVEIARSYSAQFGEPLQVNSAVRTVAYQRRLQRTNGNAAAVDGDGASPHLTGQAIDLGKRGMSVAQIAWMRSYLLPLMQSGKIDVEEEFQQACFHISVYRSYLPTKRTLPKAEVAEVR